MWPPRLAFDTCAGSKKANLNSRSRVYPGEETVFPNNSLPGPQSSPQGTRETDIKGSERFFFF